MDTEAEATAVLDLGVDGVMTDRPAMLRDLLERRDQWHPAPSATTSRYDPLLLDGSEPG